MENNKKIAIYKKRKWIIQKLRIIFASEVSLFMPKKFLNTIY